METKVLLVGVDTGEEPDFERSMEELKSLAKAALKQPVGVIVQRMLSVNKAFYIGSGKVGEVKEYARECEAEEVIFDNALSPSQIRNLIQELDLPVLDRTNLILDIFAIRAKTEGGKAAGGNCKTAVYAAKTCGYERKSEQTGGNRRQHEQQGRRRNQAGTGQKKNRASHQ